MNINEAFKFTYKLLLGECNVEMDEVKDWLLEYQVPVGYKKSAISGKPVIISSPSYPDSARFASQDEIDINSKFEPLSINEIKDIDSIVSAIGERKLVVYTGNKTFGRSEQIENCDNIVDSFCVKESHNIYNSKYVAYSSFIRDGAEYVFGSAYSPSVKYVIRSSESSLTRVFETYYSAGSSDLYCSYCCFDSVHLMFSFNLKAKKYCIGNLDLPKERYLSLRDKLLAEIREYIEKNKRFYAPFELPNISKAPSLPKVTLQQKEKNINVIDTAFRNTCRVIFGREIGGLKENEKFLTLRIGKIKQHPTAFGNEVWFSPSLAFFGSLPKDRIISCEEHLHASGLKINLGEDENPSLEQLTRRLSGIAFYTADMTEGNSVNNIESHVTWIASNTYQVADCAHAKNCAYCDRAVASENVFGCQRAVHSKFSIRCHGCTNVTACLEMEGCSNCVNSMFCHNCENLDHCMFCFNTKSKRYAIANVEVGREKYMEVKKRVMDEIVRRIEKERSIGVDIYDLHPDKS